MGKHLLRTLGLLALGLVGLCLWASGPILAEGRIGAAFVARTTCSCLFVADRSLASCRTDWPAGSEIIAVRQEENAVVASAAFGLVSARAVFEQDYGCSFPEGFATRR